MTTDTEFEAFAESAPQDLHDKRAGYAVAREIGYLRNGKLGAIEADRLRRDHPALFAKGEPADMNAVIRRAAGRLPEQPATEAGGGPNMNDLIRAKHFGRDL